MQLTGCFAVAVHMALSGKTDTLDRMRNDFRARVMRLVGRERAPEPRELSEPVTLADKYAAQRAEMQAFVEFEKTAVFRVVPDPILNAPRKP